MQTESLLSPKTLRLTLYSGIALIVTSMMFLDREVESSSLLAQAALAIIMPSFFYATGVLVYRYLEAPLAAPGIMATGAWLVAVELIHFHDRRDLLPALTRDYYWLFASLFAATVITLTAYRARIWLLVPLVPLTHINAIWAVMDATGLGIAWWPTLSFLLVLAWWEAPIRDKEWALVYRVSAVLLEVFLLIFSYWLPAQTANSMLITWGACALLVALLGLRHGWVNLGPLTIILMACAAAWGLPVIWWPPVWLVIAASTVMFIERLARHNRDEHSLAIEMSTALAVLLSGLAALLAKMLPILGVATSPLMTMLVLIGSGLLLIWIGWRRALATADHAGLWLLASGWGQLYFYWFDDIDVFGLWLSFLAAMALLAERLLMSLYRKKRKALYSIRDVVVRWPLADLVVGLSVIIVIWTGFVTMDIPVTDPLVVIATLAVVIGVWIAAGLLYRMPILLHVALWLAPLPYALFLILTVPPLRQLPMLGLAWQLLGVGFLLLGHLLPRYRPAMLAPFFLAGYALLGLGLTFALASQVLLVVGLGLVIIVCLATSILVMAGVHPAWTVLITRLVPPDERSYAFKHVHNVFVFLTAWLTAIWLHLMMGYAALPAARQGIALVLLSSAWIMLGRLLPYLPNMVGWPVYAAGWFMWFTGLLQVFFSPTEAVITAIFGLALSGEALHRSKSIHWIPVFILQVLFSALQVAWMLDIPGYSFLLAVTIGLSVAGMWYGRHDFQAGRITALTGSVLSVVIWIGHPVFISTLGMSLLALAALLVYRRWEYLAAFFGALTVIEILLATGSSWPFLLIVGGLQFGTGVVLVTQLRPRRFRTIQQVLFGELDWASPCLWCGALHLVIALLLSSTGSRTDLIVSLTALAALTAVFTAYLRTPYLPYLPILLFGAAVVLGTLQLAKMPFKQAGDPLAALSTVMALVAVMLRVLSLASVRQSRPFPAARWAVWWVRPLHETSGFLAVLSFCMMFVVKLYGPHPIWFVVNGLLLGGMGALIFWKTGDVAWMGFVLGMIWLVWYQLLSALSLHGMQWYMAPLGILLLALARLVTRIDPYATELAGIVLIIGGSLADIYAHGPVSIAAVGLMVQLAGLMIYGYVARRYVPFLSTLAMILGGVLLAVFMINPWLILLILGLALLAGVLIVETRRDHVERWLSDWAQHLNLPLPGNGDLPPGDEGDADPLPPFMSDEADWNFASVNEVPQAPGDSLSAGYVEGMKRRLVQAGDMLRRRLKETFKGPLHE